MSDNHDQSEIRQYLLGLLEDEVSLDRVEARMLSDDQFAEALELAEADLIEDYLDGKLSEEDANRFDRHFLASPENRRHLRLTENLRKIADAEPASVAAQPNKPNWLTGLFSPANQWLRFAAAALILVVVGLGVWRVAIYESDTDKSLGQLRAAFQGRRPLEPRISALPDYVPFTVTRGPENSPADTAALERAEIYLANATRDPADARAHHALALIFLTQGKYDRAEREFALALAAAPKDAAINSDAGAAYLEMAKKADAENNGARTLELLDKSLKHLDQAIAADPKLLSARFNRALGLEALMSREQAKAAWREYIELDPNSKWADEARQHLERLEAETPKELSADELETQYLAAIRQANEDLAAKLLSGNRELIREKYLPQRLSASYVKALPESRAELLKALKYTGELESKLAGDPFAKEVAGYYAGLSDLELEALRPAHSAFHEGCQKLLQQNYTPALEHFKEAKARFESSRDVWNAGLAQYFIGYSLLNLGDAQAAVAEMHKVVDSAQERSHTWLEATAQHWIGGGHTRLKQLTKARRGFENALRLAVEVKDSYAMQRNLYELAKISSFCGQRREALGYLYLAMREADRSPSGIRQAYRNQIAGFNILSAADLHAAARMPALSAIPLADGTGDPMWPVESRNSAGSALMKTSAAAEARQMLAAARAKADTIADAEIRKKMIAFCALRHGDLETAVGDLAAAERNYAEAVRYFDGTELSGFREEAHRSLLSTLSALDRRSELETKLPENVRMTEEFRSQILDEQQRSGYFDSRENIYDIGAAFELKRGNVERAYDYAESSSARSLLDWMQKGQSETQRAIRAEFAPGQGAEPLGIDEIRRRMPAAAQIVQYSVLDKELLIWVFSRENLAVRTVDISSSDLSEKVGHFSRLVLERKGGENTSRELGQELFRILIAPVRDQLSPQAEICFVPSKFLFELPFAALTTPEGTSLIKDFSIVFAPSANVFLTSTENARLRATGREERLLGLANPELASADSSGLAPLPNAETEVLSIARKYDASRLLLRRDATKSALLSSLDDADVVHFAGHYVVTPEMPSQSYLVLAGTGPTDDARMLTNAELARQKLPRTRLIVLAACRSGVEAHSAGEGMTGLSRTFLAADIPLVVGSLWSVDTQATAALMDRFHHFRRVEHLNTSAALRRAQLDLANDPSGRFSEPFYWAAFALFGGHADF